MRRLLLFTTIVALSTAYLRPSYDYARDREKPSHAHAINQFPYEDSYFDFARNLMGMSELRAKNRVPTAENQSMIYRVLASSGKPDVTDPKDMLDSVTKAKILAGLSEIVEEKVNTKGLDVAIPPLNYTASIEKATNVAPLFNVPTVQDSDY